MRNIALVLTLATITSLLAQSSSYRVIHTYTLGGDGSWDYIVPDPPNHRLFIARQNRVIVVDEDGGTLLGEITGIQGAHGTALAEATGHGFATSGNDRFPHLVRKALRHSAGCWPAEAEPSSRRETKNMAKHCDN